QNPQRIRVSRGACPLFQQAASEKKNPGRRLAGVSVSPNSRRPQFSSGLSSVPFSPVDSSVGGAASGTSRPAPESVSEPDTDSVPSLLLVLPVGASTFASGSAEDLSDLSADDFFDSGDEDGEDAGFGVEDVSAQPAIHTLTLAATSARLH